MRDWQQEVLKRVEFIREYLVEARADGIVFGNSGGKDCALVGILSKMATDNVLGVIMPCSSKINYGSDRSDAVKLSEKFGIPYIEVDLTKAKEALAESMGKSFEVKRAAEINIAPRLRMTALYAVAQSKNYLVAGTGNASERYMGYFTKWGDGAFDFDAIADLTATEIFEFLRYLGAPESIIEKAPSAGLFEGQTDEKEMGVSYREIDKYIMSGEASPEAKAVIDRFHLHTEHKRRLPRCYGID